MSKISNGIRIELTHICMLLRILKLVSFCLQMTYLSVLLNPEHIYSVYS
jgi:hypothetical protein